MTSGGSGKDGARMVLGLDHVLPIDPTLTNTILCISGSLGLVLLGA